MSALSYLLSRVALMVKVPSSFAGTFFIAGGVALDLLPAEPSGKSSTGAQHSEEACFLEFSLNVLSGFFLFFFFAGAASCEIDKQGRILIPGVLREYAGLEKDVVLVGVLSRIEIWDKHKWEESNTYDDMDEIAEHMADLGLSI